MSSIKKYSNNNNATINVEYMKKYLILWTNIYYNLN